MKKIFLLLLLILLMPILVNAEEISIKTNVSLIGKELEKDEFSFELKDKDGKVLQTKQNDLEGNVVFDPINLTEEKEYIYSIEEVNLKKSGYTYDNNKVYVKVNLSSGETTVSYYKKGSIEEQMNKEVPKYETSKAYHATEEELDGDAYAVFDYESQVMYFRRIKDLDTSNFTSQFDDTRPFNKNRAVDEANHLAYYKDLETNKNLFQNVFSEGYNAKMVKKVVFEDAFKPTFSDGTGLFADFSNRIEEVDFSHFDSSNITNMTRMFEMVQIKSLDLSSFETSQVTDMSEMFKNAKIEEIDITSFSAANLERTYYMFTYNTELVTLKISSKFSTDKVTNMQGMFNTTPKLELLDLSWLKANENTNAESLFHTCGLKYIDLSHWKFKNGSGNRRSVFATSFMNTNNLIYLDISNLTSDPCGAYASSDFGLRDTIKVIKMSNEYNLSGRMTSSSNRTFYNENINDFTNDIATNSDSCEYKAGGVYLNITDEGGDFTNYYEKIINPDKKNNIIVNPKTISTSIILLLLLIAMIVVPTLNKKLEKHN